MAHPDFGVIADNPISGFMLRMFMAYDKGISTYEFRKCRSGDIRTVQDIDTAFGEKKERERKMRDAMASMGVR